MSEKKAVLITDTTLRDGQQSLIATRMSFGEMQPILETMDNAGFFSMEVWGGATFDACLRFLKEDPWERLRKIRSSVKKTKLQMLLRGQNLLGYKNYSDDVVEAFVRKTVSNGIDIIRIFDALNDIRNLETSVKACKKEGGHAQLCISYTTSHVHTLEYYLDYTKKLISLGADSICIKDMAGLLLPEDAYKLVKAIKSVTDLPIEIHSHCTGGIAPITYFRAVEAGADILDTAISPFGGGTSQPHTEVIVQALVGTPYETNLSLEALQPIADYFKPIREKALESGLMSQKVLESDIATLIYQVPGGMLSNLVSQLKQQSHEDKYDEVLKEVPRVRADLGYPPLVTPSSQIVGTQAVMNVISGERYKMIPKETKELVKGMYGKTPVPIDKAIIKKLIGDEKPITCRPADLLKPSYDSVKKEAAPYAKSEEDVLSYALFPQIAVEYFNYRTAQEYKVDPNLADAKGKVYPI